MLDFLLGFFLSEVEEVEDKAAKLESEKRDLEAELERRNRRARGMEIIGDDGERIWVPFD